MGRSDTVFIPGTKWDLIKKALREAKRYRDAKDIREAIDRVLHDMSVAEAQ